MATYNKRKQMSIQTYWWKYNQKYRIHVQQTNQNKECKKQMLINVYEIIQKIKNTECKINKLKTECKINKSNTELKM